MSYVCSCRQPESTVSSAVLARQDRLETLAHVRDAGISVCAGGIIGLGEGEKDRVGLLHQVTTCASPIFDPCAVTEAACCRCAKLRATCIITSEHAEG